MRLKLQNLKVLSLEIGGSLIPISSKLFFVLALTLIAQPKAHSIIPDYKTIMSRVAENHGRGMYRIEQDLVFSDGSQRFEAQETWYIRGENAMRVDVKGKGLLEPQLQMSFVYDGNKRYFIGTDGSLQSSTMGPDWIEPIFHFRFSKNIKPKLVALKIAPASSLDDTAAAQSDSWLRKSEQDFLRLGRTQGKIAWAIGEPAPENSTNKPPGLWIMQDQFNILKLRLPSQIEVLASEYKQYPNKLHLPRKLEILIGSKNVTIVRGAVKALPLTPANLNLLKSTSLNKEKPLKAPNDELVRKFYSSVR